VSAAAIVTIVGAGLAVAAIAGFLIAISIVLRQASTRLQAVTDAIGAAPEREGADEPGLDGVVDELEAVREHLDRLLASGLGPRDEGSR